jgi:hypothetical protein
MRKTESISIPIRTCIGISSVLVPGPQGRGQAKLHNRTEEVMDPFRGSEEKYSLAEYRATIIGRTLNRDNTGAVESPQRFRLATISTKPRQNPWVHPEMVTFASVIRGKILVPLADYPSSASDPSPDISLKAFLAFSENLLPG